MQRMAPKLWGSDGWDHVPFAHHWILTSGSVLGPEHAEGLKWQNEWRDNILSCSVTISPSHFPSWEFSLLSVWHLIPWVLLWTVDYEISLPPTSLTLQSPRSLASTTSIICHFSVVPCLPCRNTPKCWHSFCPGLSLVQRDVPKRSSSWVPQWNAFYSLLYYNST